MAAALLPRSQVPGVCLDSRLASPVGWVGPRCRLGRAGVQADAMGWVLPGPGLWVGQCR